MPEPPILLTGATGFIGYHLARELTARGYPLRYLLRPATATDRLPATTHPDQIVRGDLTDGESLERALNGCRAVIHAAAKVSFLAADREEMRLTNEIGTTNLVNAALHVGVPHLIYLSSVAALNRESGKQTTLADRWQEAAAPTAYGRSKFAAEREVWRGQAEGLRIGVLYPSTVIGVGEWRRPGTPRLFHRAAGGLRFAPGGSAGFVSVADVVEAVRFALDEESDGLRLLLNAENLSWRNALGQIARAVGAPPPERVLSPRAAKVWGGLGRLFKGEADGLSRDLIHTANAKYAYDGSSFLTATGREYRSVKATIAATGLAYQNQVLRI